MALLFFDGFDHYATADLGSKHSGVSGCPVGSSAGRFGTNGLSIGSNNERVLRALNVNAATLIVGAAVVVSFPGSGDMTLFVFRDGGGEQVSLRCAGGNFLRVSRNG